MYIIKNSFLIGYSSGYGSHLDPNPNPVPLSSAWHVLTVTVALTMVMVMALNWESSTILSNRIV